MNITTFVRLGRRFPMFLRLAHFIFHCDISPRAHIGRKVTFCHNGLGVVIGGTTAINDNCMIYPFTLFGTKNGYPVLEEGVTVYPHSVIVGPVRIGKNAVIGACSFVDKDVPPHSIVYTKKELVVKKAKA